MEYYILTRINTWYTYPKAFLVILAILSVLPAQTNGADISASHGQPVAAKKSVRFKIVDKLSGKRVSGSITLKVALFDGSDGGDVDLLFDGRSWGATNYYNELGGVPIGTFPLDTDEVMNGAHSIEVVDGQGNRDTDKFYVFNPISEFYYDPVYANSAHSIRAHLNVPQWWRVTFVGKDNKSIRDYYGYGSSIDITWDGRDAAGHIVPHFTYDFTVKALKSHAKATGFMDF